VAFPSLRYINAVGEGGIAELADGVLTLTGAARESESDGGREGARGRADGRHSRFSGC
jgi:hypothetical protein